MDSPAGDLLAATSLVLGGLSLFYSMWNHDIRRVEAIAVKPYLADRGPDSAEAGRVFKGEACPLALAGIVVALLLVPPIVAVLGAVLDAARTSGFSAVRDYDAVGALFVAAWVGIGAIAVLATRDALAVRRKLRALARPDQSPESAS